MLHEIENHISLMPNLQAHQQAQVQGIHAAVKQAVSMADRAAASLVAQKVGDR